MIQDFQQTTMASTGLLAQANTVCSGDCLSVSLAARQLELRHRFCSHICLRQSSQPRRCASPAIAIQSKNCTASVAATATGLCSLVTSLKPSLDRSSCPWRVATHCQQMEPLLARCQFPGLSHSSLNLLRSCATIDKDTAHHHCCCCCTCDWQTPTFAASHTHSSPKTTVAYVYPDGG